MNAMQTQEIVHDLRSTLNGIQSWVYVLELRGDQDPVVARALEGIKAGIGRQVQLIESLQAMA